MKRLVAWMLIAAGMGLFMGCEWETSSDSDSWDDSVSWVDFSGTYRASDNGVLVTSYDTTAGSATTTNTVSGELLATSTAGQQTYSGTLNHTKVESASIIITVAGFTFTDSDGNGSLTGGSGITGSINYTTGAWNIDLEGNYVDDDENITATYTYTQGGAAGEENQGNTGKAIYSFVVSQTGNNLVFTDSNGATYSGKIEKVETPGGDETGATSGEANATFEVSGTSASGASVTISGTFSGTYTASTGTGVTGTMTDRTMDATWIESAGTGDILATAD